MGLDFIRTVRVIYFLRVGSLRVGHKFLLGNLENKKKRYPVVYCSRAAAHS